MEQHVDHLGADDRMRVAHVIARLNVGGPAELVLALRESAPFDVVVLAGDVQPGEADHRDVRGDRSAPVVRVPGLGRSVRPYDDARAMARLVMELRRMRPDIVHTHTAKAGVLGRAAALVARVPRRVHTFHGHLLSGYFSPAGLAAVTAAERVLARSTDRIVAVGERVRDELLAAGVGTPGQYAVIPPGLRLPGPPPERAEARSMLGLPGDRPVVSFVGRLIGVKRPDRLLETARRLPAALVAVAGEGPLYEATRAAAPDNVRFLGWRPDVHVVHAASDVALLTSDNEGMPVSLIEAALCGVPAVTTDVGSAGEVVLDGETGYAVAPDVDALTSAVEKLLADESLRQRMGAAAKARAEVEFSVERMVDAHVRLYEELMKEKPPRPHRG